MTRYGLPFFAVLWIAFVFIDYINKHPKIGLSFTHFKYPSYIIGLLIIALIMMGLKKIGRNIPINGLVTIIILFLCITIEAIAVSSYLQINLDINSIGHLYSKVGLNILAAFLILMVGYCGGRKVLQWMKLNWKGSNMLLEIGIGFIILVYLLILLGSISLLTKLAIIPLCLIIIAISYKLVKTYCKKILLEPWIENNHISIVPLYVFLIGFISINLLAILAPFPVGFDSRNLYMNMSQLIAENHSLITGSQPYPWSLFISLGYILFESPEVSQFFSFMGGLLSLSYLFYICRSHFKLSQSYSLLAVLVFIVSPAITNQLFTELKVDFGLLFFQFISLDLLLYLFRKKRLYSFQHDQKLGFSLSDSGMSNFKLFIILAIVSGFCLSIKFTHFFILFAIVIMLWAYFGSVLGFFCCFSMVFAVILFFGLDDLSGLRQYHLGIGVLRWIILAYAGILALIFFIQRKRSFFKSLFLSAIFSLISIVMISPWLIKNYQETKSFSLMTLLTGESLGLNIGIGELNQNYRELNK